MIDRRTGDKHISFEFTIGNNNTNITVYITVISPWSQSYANCFLYNYPGNFGNFIDGAAQPASKKKGPDPLGQEAAMTTPLLEGQPLKPCKSTTPPEKPVIGDGFR